MEYRVEGEMPERAAEEVSSEPACELTAMQKAWKMLREAKKNVRVAVILPPAVRTAIGEYFGLARGEDAFGKVAAAFRMIGADVVADGALAVDYALSEAVQAYLARREEDNLPLIVAPHAQAAEIGERYPGLREKVYGFAPALTLAALLRKYYNAIGDGKKTRVIVVAPAEVETDEEVLVLTTREAAVMLQSAGINVRMLKSSGADVPFVKYSGAGVLPAVSGGLSEAFVRYLLPERRKNPSKNWSTADFAAGRISGKQRSSPAAKRSVSRWHAGKRASKRSPQRSRKGRRMISRKSLPARAAASRKTDSLSPTK